MAKKITLWKACEETAYSMESSYRNKLISWWVNLPWQLYHNDVLGSDPKSNRRIVDKMKDAKLIQLMKKTSPEAKPLLNWLEHMWYNYAMGVEDLAWESVDGQVVAEDFIDEGIAILLRSLVTATLFKESWVKERWNEPADEVVPILIPDLFVEAWLDYMSDVYADLFYHGIP